MIWILLLHIFAVFMTLVCAFDATNSSTKAGWITMALLNGAFFMRLYATL